MKDRQLASELSVSDTFALFHEGNHGINGDPHSQYIIVQPLTKTPQGGQTNNKWIRIAVMKTIERNFATFFFGEIEVWGGNNSYPVHPLHGKLKVMWRLDDKFTNNRVSATYNINDFEIITMDDFAFICTKNNTGDRELEIWMRSPNAWDDIYLRLNMKNHFRTSFSFDGHTIRDTKPTEVVPLTSLAIKEKIPPITYNFPTLQNGWVADASGGGIRVTRQMKTVVIQGTISGGTYDVATAITLCTLPAEYRPNNTMIVPVIGYNTSWVPIQGIAKINIDGTIKLEKLVDPITNTVTIPSANIKYLSISGYSYYVG